MGFLHPPCVQQESHKPQTHACCLEEVAVGKLFVVVVDRKHGSVSLRDASDVAGTLRSP